MPVRVTRSQPICGKAILSPAEPDAEPVFTEPWQAQAFAMAVKLHERGIFTWKEWATTLSEEIKSAQTAGDPDLGTTYYHHWLKALERMVVEKGVATEKVLVETAHAWEDAARATPHGKPIVLGAQSQMKVAL